MEENQPQAPQKDFLLPLSILVAGIMISGSIIYVVGRSSSQPAAEKGNVGTTAAVTQTPTAGGGDKLELGARDVILGDPKAPVTLVEYGDFQCPFCGRFFEDTEQQIRNNYVKNGKVRMVFRNFQFLGAESFAAGEAAECAKDQQKFWPYHDLLYQTEVADGKENNGNLTRDLFIKLAHELNLDEKTFTSCIDSHKYADLVKSGTQNGQALGVNSTPTIFINNQKFLGALPYGDFQAAIDDALKGSK